MAKIARYYVVDDGNGPDGGKGGSSNRLELPTTIQGFLERGLEQQGHIRSVITYKMLTQEARRRQRIQAIVIRMEDRRRSSGTENETKRKQIN